MTLTPSPRTPFPGLLVAAPAGAVILAVEGSQLIQLAACSVLAALSLWWALGCVGRSRAPRQSTLGYLTPALFCIGATALFGIELASMLSQFIAPLGAVHAP